MTSAPSQLPAAPPLHGCVRCGTPIPIEESMCERCNPLGLKAPAASQAHGTVFVGIAVAVVIMAVVARMLTADIGPFRSSVLAVSADPAGLRVTVSIHNDGSAAGATTCRIGDPTIRGIGPETVFVTSPVVEPGETRNFEVVVAGLGTSPKPISVDCDT